VCIYVVIESLCLLVVYFADESLSHPLRQPLIQTRELLKHTPFVYSFTDRVEVSMFFNVLCSVIYIHMLALLGTC